MGQTGTLEECMDKLYTLYMANRIQEVTVGRYLSLLRGGVDARRIFSQEQVDKLLEILQRDKGVFGSNTGTEEETEVVK